MAEKATATAAAAAAGTAENTTLETSKSERQAWLMKCPPIVSSVLQHQSSTPPPSDTHISAASAAIPSGRPVGKIIVAVDPLRTDFTYTQFTMELAGSEPGNIPKCYSMDMSADILPLSIFSESSQGRPSVEGKIHHKFDLKPHNENTIAVQDRLESLCRELQCQNKTLMDECKRMSTEGQNLRLDISNKFQDAIKEVSNRMQDQKDECVTLLKENETLKCELKQVSDQYAHAERQYTRKLKQKELELQLADLKIQQNEERIQHEESSLILYAEQVSELQTSKENLRAQLAADGEKLQQFQEALSERNKVVEVFRQEIDKISKSVKELIKENTFWKSKCEKSDIDLIDLAKERDELKKQLQEMQNHKEKLEFKAKTNPD